MLQNTFLYLKNVKIMLQNIKGFFLLFLSLLKDNLVLFFLLLCQRKNNYLNGNY